MSQFISPFIVVITGIAGSGKTTIAKMLCEKLNATYIGWDSYDDLTVGPSDYLEWFKDDHDNWKAWDARHMAEDLKCLKIGIERIHPVSKEKLKATEVIIFDSGLGRWHQQTGEFIDYQVYLDVPPDITLARRAIRSFQDGNKDFAPTVENLEWYLKEGRQLFVDNGTYAKYSDLIISGYPSVKETVAQIMEKLKEVRNSNRGD